MDIARLQNKQIAIDANAKKRAAAIKEEAARIQVTIAEAESGQEAPKASMPMVPTMPQLQDQQLAAAAAAAAAAATLATAAMVKLMSQAPQLANLNLDLDGALTTVIAGRPLSTRRSRRSCRAPAHPAVDRRSSEKSRRWSRSSSTKTNSS